MAFIGYCIPCQLGDHDGHYEVVQAVPEGVIGGARCDCKGECREFPQPEPVLGEALKPIDFGPLDDASLWGRA